MSLKKFTPGEPVTSFPGRSWNQMVDYVQPFVGRGGVRSRPSVGIGGGGGGGSAESIGYIYDDLPGYSREGITTVVVTSRFLPKIETSTNTYDVDLNAAFINVQPGLNPEITLSESSGCNATSDSQSLTGSTLSFDFPIETNGFVNITDDEHLSIEISGSGSKSSSTVAIRFLDPANPATVESGPHAANVANDGTWAATINVDADISTEGVYLVQAIETDTDSFAHKPITAPLFLATHSSTQNGIRFDTPPAPDLLQSSDTGDSNDDNVTEDTTPTFLINRGSSDYDAAGMTPVLYIDGVEVARGDGLSFELSSTVELTPGTALTEGTYSATCALIYDEGGGGLTGDTFTGQSEPLYFSVESASSSGSITATCLTSSAFDPDNDDLADPIPVDTVVITNTTSSPAITTPAAPTTIPQPDHPFEYPDNYELKLTYINSAWKLDTTKQYCREAIVNTIGNAVVVKQVGPCPIEITYSEKVKLDS